ncbi:InlB B-repeat-containing protein, partial [Candidatus Saccharibacteria bacterium]|nr:InlB B-repeat-containing protein [Candidatus Saccharibacteria bacterium]
GDILDTTTETDPQTNEYNLTFGVKTDIDTPAGTYNKTFTLTAVANEAAYSVAFDANAGDDEVTNMPDPNPQTTGVSGVNLVLSSAIPQRSGYNFLGWSEDQNATTATYYPDGNYPLDATIYNAATLYAVWKNVSDALTYNMYANGGTYTNNTPFNSVYYQASCASVVVGTSPQYSHTPNLLDDGNRNMNYSEGNGAGNYKNSYDQTEVITIPGAKSLHISLTYGGESASFDWASVWYGAHPDYTAYNDYDAAEKVFASNKFGGGSATVIEGVVYGVDTITIAFRSDGGGHGNGYGYYAVVTALNADGNTLSTGDSYEECSYQIATGIYEEPTRDGYVFLGWSANPNATEPSYTMENELLDNPTGAIGEIKNYYAVWTNSHVITIAYGLGVSSVVVDNNTLTNGDTIILGEGQTYPIFMNTDDGYTIDNWSATTGTIASQKRATTYTVGLGNATLTATAKIMQALQSWNDCASLNVDDEIELYDIRDNQVYTVTKWKMIADGSQTACWIKDNLNLGAEPLVVNELNAANTNIVKASAVSKSDFESNWINHSGSQSYIYPRILSITNDNSPSGSDTDSYGNKYGTLYNFAAASVGTVVADSGDLPDGENSADSLCPYGWRLPITDTYPNTQAASPIDLPSINEYEALVNANSITFTTLQSEFNFPISGSFSGSGIYNFNEMAHYWSSTEECHKDMFVLEMRIYYGTEYLYASTYIDRASPGSIKCVLADTASITYDANGGLGAPLSQSGTVDPHEGFTLSATEPTKDNYVFAGWSEDQNATTADYLAGESYLGLSGDVVLYAVWVPARTITVSYSTGISSIMLDGSTLANNDTIVLGEGITYRIIMNVEAGYGIDNWSTTSGSIEEQKRTTYYEVGPNDGTIAAAAKVIPAMQGWNGCSSLNINDELELYDIRDGTAYTIAKLGDGKCWMTQNLRLDLSLYGDQINTSNTNNPTSIFLASANQNPAASANFKGEGYDADRYDVVKFNTMNIGDYSLDHSGHTYDEGGIYYTWYTATAGNGVYNSNDATADGDLCPSGWSLPTGGETGDFFMLNTAINSGATDTAAGLLDPPANFMHSRYFSEYYARINYHDNVDSHYWSSTRQSNSYAYTLHINAYYDTAYSYIGPGTATIGTGSGATVRCLVGNNYRIHFDPNTEDQVFGAMVDQYVRTGATTQLNANRFYRQLGAGSGYRFIAWNTEPDGSGISYGDGAFVSDLVTADSAITLYAQWDLVSPLMAIEMKGNGLSFDNNSNSNTLYYYNDCRNDYAPIERYSHTSNINDSGVNDGNYDSDLATKDVITIPGASKLRATITYSTEDGWDMLYVFEGEYTGNVTHDMSAGQLQTYHGSYSAMTTVVLDIPGDTATFAFYSDGGVEYYGYYAVINALDGDDNIMQTAEAIQTCSRSLVAGEYQVPSIPSNHKFLGWSEDQNATTADYTKVADLLNIAGENGETKTLYAIWHYVYIIHFDGNGATSGTMTDQIITSGATESLNYNSFYREGYRFIGWSEDPNAATFTYRGWDSYTAPDNGGEITLYAVWGLPYSIVYDGNGATDGEATESHNDINEGYVINLYASNYARPGYGFVGWSTDPLAQPNDGISTIYGPNETIDAPAYPGSDVLTLYAIWIPKDTAYTLQDFDSAAFESANPSVTITALEDTRDGNVYAVSKLADGKWWMIENLRLNPADPNTTITKNNTNNPTDTFIDADIVLSNIQNASGDKAYVNPYYRTCTDSSISCIDQISFGISNLNGTTASPSNYNQDTRWYSYGVMYNWYTATAGNGTYSGVYEDGAVAGDICPSGWRLPSIGDSSSDFSNLDIAIGGNGTEDTDIAIDNLWHSYPNNFLMSGHYRGTARRYTHSCTVYWGNVPYSNDGGAVFYTDYNDVVYASGAANYKYDGAPVRCVAKSTPSLSLSLGTGVASVTVDGVTYDGGTPISLAENSTHTINMTLVSGYEFDNWSISGAGTTLGSTSTQSTTITIGTVNVTLIANAKPINFDSAFASAGKTKQGSYYTMQDMTASICSSVGIGQTGILIDIRDGTEYTVAKLADGKCWMTQNMRLDFSSSAITTQSVADLESATNNPASGFWAAAQGATASNSGFGSSNYDIVKYSKINIGDNTTDSTDHTYDEYGIYYNWYTATAGQGTRSKSSGNTDGDLCPSGWHLPTGNVSNTDGDFYDLNVAINSGSTTDYSGLIASPASFLYSGSIADSSYMYRGTSGIYWSSTAFSTNSDQAFLLYFGSDLGVVWPGIGLVDKTMGQPIRCLVDGSTTQQSPDPEPAAAPQQSNQQSSPVPVRAQSAAAQQTAHNDSIGAEDETKDESSEETNVQPLGVNKELDEAVSSAANISNSDNTTSIFGTIAIVGAGIATTTGLLLLASKKREEDECGSEIDDGSNRQI